MRLRCATFVLLLCFVLPACSGRPSLQLAERPEWLARDGLVMAGSWEPLLFRVRRDGAPGYTPTKAQRADYLREHGPEITRQLKDIGVNFIMMHCYKGAGRKAEAESMAEAVGFARYYREQGLRVGVYNFSGAFIWELLFKETPQAKDWVLLDSRGKPRPYSRTTYRYYWNRNHPDAQAFYKQIIRFAIEEMGVDLLHFDNYSRGPGHDANSKQRFRQYLQDRFTPNQLRQMGITDPTQAQPPQKSSPALLKRARWDFLCQSLADSYHEMSRYARSLRKNVLIECNCQGVHSRTRPPVDHGRILQGGEAFWDESRRIGYSAAKKQLRTRIRTYKVARKMKNMAFAYVTTPLEMAESMAFNRDSLGCVVWFEYGKIIRSPGNRRPVSPEARRYIRFFRQRRDLLARADVVADVAVLRSFPSQVFSHRDNARMTAAAEKACIDNRVPFQIVYDHHLDDLSGYRALVLAGCVAMGDDQIAAIRRYVAAGGRLCIVGPVATHDQWMLPCATGGLGPLPVARVVRIDKDGDVLDAIGRTCDYETSLRIDAPAGVCAELTRQPDRRLVHLVNYRNDGPVGDLVVHLRLPAGRRGVAVTLAGPDHPKDTPLAFVQDEGVVTFIVPKLTVYEIAVVALK